MRGDHQAYGADGGQHSLKRPGARAEHRQRSPKWDESFGGHQRGAAREGLDWFRRVSDGAGGDLARKGANDGGIRTWRFIKAVYCGSWFLSCTRFSASHKRLDCSCHLSIPPSAEELNMLMAMEVLLAMLVELLVMVVALVVAEMMPFITLVCLCLLAMNLRASPRLLPALRPPVTPPPPPPPRS